MMTPKDVREIDEKSKVLDYLAMSAQTGNYLAYCEYLEWATNQKIPDIDVAFAYQAGVGRAVELPFFTALGGVKGDHSWFARGYKTLTLSEKLHVLNGLSESAKRNDALGYRHYLVIAKQHGITMTTILNTYNQGRSGIGAGKFTATGQRGRV